MNISFDFMQQADLRFYRPIMKYFGVISAIMLSYCVDLQAQCPVGFNTKIEDSKGNVLPDLTGEVGDTICLTLLTRGMDVNAVDAMQYNITWDARILKGISDDQFEVGDRNGQNTFFPGRLSSVWTAANTAGGDNFSDNTPFVRYCFEVIGVPLDIGVAAPTLSVGALRNLINIPSKPGVCTPAIDIFKAIPISIKCEDSNKPIIYEKTKCLNNPPQDQLAISVCGKNFPIRVKSITTGEVRSIANEDTLHFGGLVEGDNYFEATDAVGNTTKDTIFMGKSPKLMITAIDTIKNSACNESTVIGAIHIKGVEGGDPFTAPNGNPGYIFKWNTGYIAANDPSQRDVRLGNLQDGTYSVRIEDSLGCYIDWEYTLRSPNAIIVDTIIGRIDCLKPQGSINVNISGGTPNPTTGYEFNLSFTPIGGGRITTIANNIDVTNNYTNNNLPEGHYTLEVSDINSFISPFCSTKYEFDIISSGSSTLTPISKTAIKQSCNGLFGYKDGSMNFVLAKDPNIQFEIDNLSYNSNPNDFGATPTTISSSNYTAIQSADNVKLNKLQPGKYFITGSVNGGTCVLNDSFLIDTVTDYSKISNIRADTITCNSPLGYVAFDLVYPNNMFQIKWEQHPEAAKFMDKDSLFSSIPGNFSVTVSGKPSPTSSETCETNYPVILSSKGVPVISAKIQKNLNCFNNVDGVVELMGNGSNGSPLDFNTVSIKWVTDKDTSTVLSTNSVYSGVGGGDYFAKWTDQEGCSGNTNQITVNAPKQIIFDTSASIAHHTSCYNGDDAFISIMLQDVLVGDHTDFEIHFDHATNPNGDTATTILL